MKTVENKFKKKKRLKTVENCWKQLKMVENGWKRLKTVENWWKRLKTIESGWKRLKTVESGWKWLKTVDLNTINFAKVDKEGGGGKTPIHKKGIICRFFFLYEPFPKELVLHTVNDTELHDVKNPENFDNKKTWGVSGTNNLSYEFKKKCIP